MLSGTMFRLPFFGALIVTLIVASGCGPATRADATDITGVMPPLAFSMIRANDSKPVSAADYRGKATLLYFGYTRCPDECPTTLANIAAALRRLGPTAQNVRVLFVSVDPARDTIPVLKEYVRAFAPQIDGMRGSDNAVAVLARRFRVLYTVTPASPGHAYEVMHSDSLFLFDASGRARYVLTSTANTASLASMIGELNG
ncbi:MAG TPA: SCO family protein [Rhizomicrobium sp.]|jgi:protein SCO1/2|nr:SCO family protein [Rhizomicrobium sp.]